MDTATRSSTLRKGDNTRTTEERPSHLIRQAGLIAVTFLFGVYRWVLNPFLKAIAGSGYDVCKHVPSCSEYAEESFRSLPWHKASWFSVLRILKCNPWQKSGFVYDPVSTQR